MKNLAILVIVLVILLAIVSQLGVRTLSTPPVKPTPAKVQAKQTEAVYKGTLACADCSGINTTLTLYSDETYTLSSVYQGKNDNKPFVEHGKWTTLRGDATDPDATVYQLYQQGTKDEQNYLVDGDQLKQLDTDLNPINAPFNTSLTKQPAK
jgi:copper homeostasis protein (lipoprotein)